jgi:hypothetical protein
VNIVKAEDKSDIMERVIALGDLGKLSPEERTEYYLAVCKSVGLNPLTKPFDYIPLGGKLTLYANRSATDQLRTIHKVSLTIVSREMVGDCYIVTARATKGDGTSDESTGAVAMGGLRGDALANAYMKAETKAKRRVTLSACGLGMLDESEVVDIPKREKEFPQPVAVPFHMTEEFMGLIRQVKVLQASHGITNDQISEVIFREFVKKNSKDLTKEELLKLISYLMDLNKEEKNKEEEKNGFDKFEG